MKRDIVLSVTSDHHCGSTVGLCPPEKIGLDDGGFYEPSPAQKFIWSCWEDYWLKVRAARKEHRAELYVVLNGDLFDGDHHGTPQIVSPNLEGQNYIAHRAFGGDKRRGSPLEDAKPDHLFIVRGTEAHVGPQGATEEAFARSLHAIPDESTSSRPIWSWWRLQLELNGTLVDFQHHGRMGSRPWTEQNVVSNLAAQIFYEHARKKLRHPDIAFRSHHHQWADTHRHHPTRVIQTPAWQLKTAYAHKVAPESLADIGGIIVILHPDGTYRVEEHLYSTYKVQPWRPGKLPKPRR